jgi:hypothetical protein
MNANSLLLLVLVGAALAGGFIVFGDSPTSTGPVGYYRIVSNAEGSDVYFDSVFQGQVRNGEITVPVDISSTTYQTYTLRTPGGNEIHGYIPETPLPGKTVILRADIAPVKSAESPGSLTIIADPPGAMVYVNGAFAGTIPVSGVLQFQRYQPGNYSIELRLAGYQTYAENIIVSPGSETTINVDLNRSTTGGIDFISFPRSALVFLDDTYIGVTPLHLGNVSYGAHQARITLKGYQDWSALVLAKPDVTIPVTARLFPLSIETATPTPTRTKLAFPVLGLVIALFVAGFGKWTRKI